MSPAEQTQPTQSDRDLLRRWGVVGALFSLSVLTIVDRVAISAAQADMSRDLGLGDVTFGFIFGAFTLGYALFQIPAGYLADRFGPRVAICTVVGLWSIFTSMTAVVRAAALLISVRFLFGAAEAGAFPAAARAIKSWLPSQETGVAQGILFSGSRLGAAFGLMLTSWSVIAVGWRPSFIALGGIGILWTVAWARWFRDSPDPLHPASTAKNEENSWHAIVAIRQMPALMLQYFASNFTFFLCFSWLLPFLRERYHLSVAAAGFYSAIPLYFGAAANWVSGATVDALYRKKWGRRSRALPAAFGFLLGAAALLGAARSETVVAAVAFFAVATFGVDVTLSPSWTLCIDVAGDRAGTLTGAMNMAGNIGAFASSIAFPVLLHWTGSSNTYFFSAAVFNVAAALIWLTMPSGSLSPQDEGGIPA